MNTITYQSRVVKIGGLALGGNNPVRIQSMTSTSTMDTAATVSQAIRMIDAGCEYVRITAPFVKDALNLKNIKEELLSKGYKNPLIADIHYLPKAADIAAGIVEKVRINPGNYIDRKRGRMSFSEEEYHDEINKIRQRIQPLIKICKLNGTALRIGSNHGSLSERILLRYGDTPRGMVESAMEFIHICHDLDFHDIVLSMKASNVKIMVQANRLLLKRMMEEGMNYPIHLGVTEAGDAEDGRIKSVAGIAPLLIDGVGDTIRVSLTEDPEFEIPVAHFIRQLTTNIRKQSGIKPNEIIPGSLDFSRRKTQRLGNIGGDKLPVVILNKPDGSPSFLKAAIPDYYSDRSNNALHALDGSHSLNVEMIRTTEDLQKVQLDEKNQILVFDLNAEKDVFKVKNWFHYLDAKGIDFPVILYKDFESEKENLLLEAATYFSYFLIDGFGDGLWISAGKQKPPKLSQLAFGILQATGSRISKTEFIACPSCGRTLFNIQETLQKVKAKTHHIKGLKIAVMGCCVNGPGEMADADFGYVGAGKGKISLYKGKTILKQNIPEHLALNELIALIKENGRWEEQE